MKLFKINKEKIKSLFFYFRKKEIKQYGMDRKNLINHAVRIMRGANMNKQHIECIHCYQGETVKDGKVIGICGVTADIDIFSKVSTPFTQFHWIKTIYNKKGDFK